MACNLYSNIDLNVALMTCVKISSPNFTETFAKTGDEMASMVGDTNLFFADDEEDAKVAEAEIMVAERWARGRRIGWEATCLMLRYGAEELNVTAFQAKIKEDNLASIKMFEKLGFVETAHSEVFKEITLRLKVTEGVRRFLSAQTAERVVEQYEHIDEEEKAIPVE